MSLFRTLTGQSNRSHRSHRSQQHDQANSELTPRTSSSHPERPVLRHTVSSNSATDPYAGHLNHLTEYQDNQLSKFKSTLVEHGLYRPGSNGQDPSHDAQSLLRYLRARKFDIAGALAQFSDTEKWSRENQIPELYESIDVEFYERARQMYPQWTGHRDKRGIPVYVYVVKHLDTKHVNAYAKDAAAYKATLPFHSSLSTPAKMLPLFALYENLLRFVIPLCTSIEARPHLEVPVSNSNNIVDISGVGLKQFWNLKNHMQESSVLATAHYPETLDRIFIIGAPSFFPTVWGWIKRWFDPVTVNKIFVIPQNEVTSRLSDYIHPDDFPKKYGGNLEWEFGMKPDLDDQAREAVEKNGSKGWIEGPSLWQHGQRVPVGTVDGKPRRPLDVKPLEPAPNPSAPVPALGPAQPALGEVRSHPSPPSMTNSGSTASTSNLPPPEARTIKKNGLEDDKAKMVDPQAPSIIVTNGEVTHEPHDRPQMERFVTAAEDLKRTSPSNIVA